MAIPLKYQAKEVLNKVLNTAEDALNVDLADSVTVTVDSEFPAAAAITDNFANPTTTSAMSMLMGYDGSAWDRVTIGGGAEAAALRVTIASDSTGVVTVDDGGGALTVDGTVTANLSSTDNAVLDAMVVDLAAMEVLLTAANVDHAANEALLITIDSDTDAIKTAVQLIDNAISGTEMQVDVVAALPAGSNTIGVVDLGSTDNAVLDAMVVDLAEIEVATEASQAALEKMLYGTAVAITAVSGGSDQDIQSGAAYEALYIGVGGDVTVTLATDTEDILFKNLASGQLLPIRLTDVKASNTTATYMIALKA